MVCGTGDLVLFRRIDLELVKVTLQLFDCLDNIIGQLDAVVVIPLQ